SSAADNQQQHHHGEVVDRVCSAVVGALRAFPNALGVQAEGCVAALLLCRRSPRFAPCLVENDAFDCLFHIVRTSLKKRGLLRLAAECLHELVLSRGQKDAALLRAIRNGNSKLARCLLELGANPNAVSAEDSSSLICLALASFQSPSDLLDTVYCLLEKGAVNTQSALEKSLTLGTDMRAAFGSITWCNLKLQSFQARWLDPVIKPRTPEQELTEVRIRKVSKLIREAARSHHSNGGGLNSPRRRASTAASSASTSGAPAAGAGAGSAGAVIGLDDILPERYRLAQWTSASNPGKTSQPSETGSQQQLDIVDDGRRQQQQQSGGGGMSRRGSMVSLLLGRMPPFFKRADSLGEVRGDGDKQQQRHTTGKKKLSDGADSSAASASNASAKSNSRDRRRTLAPEVLASQIEQFRKRSDTIRSDPDAAVAGVAAAASTSEVPSGPASYSTSDIQFQPVEGELQEFYQSTLSSSNLPYSQLDPRLRLPHPKQRPRHRQVEQQPAAGNNLEVRRGSYLLRCADADAAACDASAAVAVSENPNGEDDDDDYDVDDVDDDNDDDDDEIGDEVDESICGDEDCFDDETTDFSEDAGRHRGRRLLLEAGTSEDSGGRGGGDHSDSVVKVRRHRRLLRDRGRGSCGRTQLSTSAPSSPRPEQLRLIDLSANCIPDVDSLACIAADIDLQVSLAFLNRLSLANNKLTRLPQGVFQFLSNLAHVELNGNRLIEFPYELITCCRLEYLDVSDNDIVELREERLQWVGAVFTLRELLLSRNKLRSVPMRFLENLYGLERLMLNGNRIGELEPAPLQLKRLRCLSLASNYIRAVPDEFLGCLTNLEEFDASCNELEVLPTPETSRKLYHLSTVRLSNNQLGAKDPLSVPSFVLELSILKSIDLSYNSIDQFPSPKNWASAVLREIDLSHNRIDSVNLNGGDRWSKTLERFSLAYNEIKTLHKGIGQLESLASLDLSHNPNLTSLPDEIGNLSKLWEMPLDGLKLSLDASLIRGRTKDLVGYFHQKLNKSVSHYRMKLMLVGFGGRGKTSLLRALMKLKQPERQSPRPWASPSRRGRSAATTRKQKWVTYQLSCWDFAGQEEFYATHQCFLSQRAIYLLIYSLQSCSTVEGCDAELRRLKPWLVNIKAQAPACPVICVGTHADTLPSSGPNRDTIIANIRTRIETMIRRPGFPEIVEYVEVNAIRDNASVERLRTDLPVLQWYQLRKMATDAGLNMNDEKLSQAVRFLPRERRAAALRRFNLPGSTILLRILEKFEIVLPQKNDELLIPCRLPDIAARDVTELAPVRRHS
uniref:Non-specific serine/threonine protein kinase n=1 Tax=Macrostomum lignano TaxID=282301 RepID=A0A1I8JHB6_9PLAT